MKIRHTEHVTTVPAPPDTVYDMIADAARWPAIFSPTVHVEYLSPGPEDEQRLRVWAFAGDSVASWVSHRTLDKAVRRVGFRQTSPAAPVAAMRGEWRVFPSGDESRVVFRHWFAAEHDDEAILGKIEAVVNRNSLAELASLRAAAGRAHLIVDFEDETAMDGGQAGVYRFLAQAQEWPELLPHVSRVALTEQPAGVQVVDMDTVESGGGEAVHNTVSVRVLLPPGVIVYKQTTLPPFLTAHVGSWHVRADGTTVARHTVVLKEEAIAAMLGPGATVEQAAGLVRQAIGGNSRATLRRARELVTASR
jgi:aromatase